MYVNGPSLTELWGRLKKIKPGVVLAREVGINPPTMNPAEPPPAPQQAGFGGKTLLFALAAVMLLSKRGR